VQFDFDKIGGFHASTLKQDSNPLTSEGGTIETRECFERTLRWDSFFHFPATNALVAGVGEALWYGKTVVSYGETELLYCAAFCTVSRLRCCCSLYLVCER
jgi:hypothetical protein